jgi:hypothetical protein
VDRGERLWLLGLLLVPTIGIAFCDVVIDALMVETGQPLGLCGRLQSVQWACLYAASIGTGTVGGWLSATGHQAVGFALCAAAMALSFSLAWALVREPASSVRGTARDAVGALWSAARHPGVAAVTVFLFLWSFNPFGTSVQYVHATEHLHLSELAYGETLSVQSASAQVVAVLYGASYMVGSLMVLDIAALLPARAGRHRLLPAHGRDERGGLAVRGHGRLDLHEARRAVRPPARLRRAGGRGRAVHGRLLAGGPVAASGCRRGALKEYDPCTAEVNVQQASSEPAPNHGQPDRAALLARVAELEAVLGAPDYKVARADYGLSSPPRTKTERLQGYIELLEERARDRLPPADPAQEPSPLELLPEPEPVTSLTASPTVLTPLSRPGRPYPVEDELEAVRATLDRLGIPEGPLLWRLGFLEALASSRPR